MSREEFVQKYSAETRYSRESIEALATAIERRVGSLKASGYELAPTLDEGFASIAGLMAYGYWTPDQLTNVLTEII